MAKIALQDAVQAATDTINHAEIPCVHSLPLLVGGTLASIACVALYAFWIRHESWTRAPDVALIAQGVDRRPWILVPAAMFLVLAISGGICLPQASQAQRDARAQACDALAAGIRSGQVRPMSWSDHRTMVQACSYDRFDAPMHGHG